jgi:hypothetical protein
MKSLYVTIALAAALIIVGCRSEINMTALNLLKKGGDVFR